MIQLSRHETISEIMGRRYLNTAIGALSDELNNLEGLGLVPDPGVHDASNQDRERSGLAGLWIGSDNDERLGGTNARDLDPTDQSSASLGQQ